jgi:hypothetical protein
LLAGTQDNHLVIFDISTPQNPTQLASISVPDLPYQIVTSVPLAFLADPLGGLLIYDISVPGSPALLSQTSFSGVYGVAVDGTVALLAARENGLVLVDITDPTHPQKAQLGVAGFGGPRRPEQPEPFPCLLDRHFWQDRLCGPV